MTGETLNIKIRLDTSEIVSGVKRVKTQLTGMAGQVKKSIPQLNTESKKAAKSLDGVSKAGADVKKTIGKIGDEAKDSLSDVVTQSNKIKAAFKDISSSGSKINLGVSTDGMSESAAETTSSLQEMQDTMNGILGLQFASVLAKPFKGLLDNIKANTKEIIKGKRIIEFMKEIAGETEKTSASIRKIKKEIESVKKEAVSSFAAIGKAIGGALLKLTAFSAALLAVAGGMIATGTKEYREEQAKLVSAFQSAGAGAEEATQAYRGIFRFLGESSTAVEAANHLAKLTTNTKELAEWTTICQGVYATFGDSLRVEGLTEAANETARSGVVTGVLADALVWMGVQEDAFNEKLAKTTSLSEREALIRTTLNGLYSDAAALYEQNNKAAIAQNEAQARLSATMGKIGQQTQVLLTSLTNLANTVLTVLAPAISYVSAVFSVLIDKLAQAIQWIGSLLGISSAVDTVTGIVSGAGTGLNTAAGSAGELKDNLDAATSAAEKLKKTTMGFDELNIVTNPNTASSSSTDIGVSDTSSVPTLNTGILSQIGEQTENIKAKAEEFFDKWKTQIGIIGAALAGLGISGILTHLGKAIELGNTFLDTMKTIKKLAASAITIVLQYTLVNEFLDNFIEGGGLKEYIKAMIVSALGTWVLYSMWGTGGLVIGLGVTAVASIKSVIDNGGITNVESFTTALTGLAASIGAVALAWKKLGLGAAIAKVAGAFPKLSTAVKGAAGVVTGAGSSITGFLGSIGTAFFGATGAGAIAAGAAVVAAAVLAVVSVIVFLKENWEAVSKAAQDFFKLNIAPKLEELKKSWEKIVDALKSVGDAFVNLGKTIWNALPDGLKDWLADVADGIGKVVKAIGEWFKSVPWLEAIGGVVFGVVSGGIMGAIDMLIGAIEGFVRVISGVVEIVSGVIEAVVRLFSGDLKGAWEAVKQIGQGIVDVFAGLYDATVGAVANFVKGIINWFVELWDELVGHSIVPDMIDAIVDWFWKLPTKVGEAVKKFVSDVIARFKEMWNSVKSWFNSNVAPKFTTAYWNTKFDTIRQSVKDKLTQALSAVKSIWSTVTSWFKSTIAPKFTKTYWNTKFDAIRQSASEKLNVVKTTIQSAWSTISSWFKSNIAPKFTTSFWANKFNAIKDGAKSALNGLISIVERALNSIISRVNTFQISIPSWVPQVGGRSFGINLRSISIPRLAEGGIVTSSTLANIGEAGREAVLPLDNNTQWMDKLADKITARNSTPTKIVLMVGERELGWATIDSINGITKQTGGLQLQLA